MIRDLVDIKNWIYYRLEIEDEALLSVNKGIVELSDLHKSFIKQWSYQQFNKRQLIEVENINELPVTMLTPGNCVFDNDNIRRQFIVQLRKGLQ